MEFQLEYEPNYQVSTDYKHLAQLLREGKRVVCFVTTDYNECREKNPLFVTDVCDARFSTCDDDKFTGFMVGCRGRIFFDAYNYHLKYVRGAEQMTLDEYFCTMCEHHKLEFIEPTR